MIMSQGRSSKRGLFPIHEDEREATLHPAKKRVNDPLNAQQNTLNREAILRENVNPPIREGKGVSSQVFPFPSPRANSPQRQSERTQEVNPDESTTILCSREDVHEWHIYSLETNRDRMLLCMGKKLPRLCNDQAAHFEHLFLHNGQILQCSGRESNRSTTLSGGDAEEFEIQNFGRRATHAPPPFRAPSCSAEEDEDGLDDGVQFGGDCEDGDDDGNGSDTFGLNLPRHPPIPTSCPFAAYWFDEETETTRRFKVPEWTEMPDFAELGKTVPRERYWATIFLCMRKHKSKFLKFLEMPRKRSMLDVKDAWAAFMDREASLSGMPKEYLVRFSGTMNAELGVLLHFPTFNTAKIKLSYGETMDPSNPSLRIMSKKGLSSDSALVGDLYCRRQKCLDPGQRKFGRTSMTERWSQELQDLHTEYAWEVVEQSAAKVWLMCGSHVQKTWRKRFFPGPNSRFQLESLYMPASEMKLEIGIEYFKVGGEIRRLFIFCPHPESILWTGGYRNKGSRLDDAYNLAAILTDSPCDWNFGERFYVHQCGKKGPVQRADERQASVHSGSTAISMDQATADANAAEGILRRLGREADDPEELDEGVNDYLLNGSLDAADEEMQWEAISTLIDKMSANVSYERHLDPMTSTLAIDVGGQLPLVKLRVIEVEDEVTFSWTELPSAAREVCKRAKISVGVAERLQQKWPNYTLVQCLFRAVRESMRMMAESSNVKRRATSRYAHLYSPPDPSRGQATEVWLQCPVCTWRKKDVHPTYDERGRYLVRHTSCHRCPPENAQGWSPQRQFVPEESDLEKFPRYRYDLLVKEDKY
jgi:hypothetical protein